MKFQRGYKSWCENISLSLRKELGLKKNDPLMPRNLAQHLGIPLLTPNEIKGLSQTSKNVLLDTSSFDWSAVTIYSNNSELIIFNPCHSDRRQSTDLMHELSHIIRGHTPSNSMYSAETGIILRNYNKELEDEADWLAGTLLLPKDILFSIKWAKLSQDEACLKYTVSKDLLKMRLNLSGANKIYSRSAGQYRK